MPQLNSRKKYVENAYYHIYNRGVNKGKIFYCQWNRDIFLLYLDQAARRFQVEILKYVLTTNHFHLIVKQREDPASIAKMMQSLSTRYAVYFNLNYDRVGSLFQSRYRARLLETDLKVIAVQKYLDHHTKFTDEIFEEVGEFEF